jgi:cytochrome c-type biogenesis protein CcmF
MMLYPERRTFLSSQITQTVVALQSSPLRDLYIVYDGRSPETGKPEIHAHLNPLVKWIWFGGIVVVLGTGLAMLPNRRAVLVLRAAAEKSWGEGVAPESPSAAGAVTRRADAHD